MLDIVSRSQAVREKAKKHFKNQKQQWIKKGRARGAENPEREVFQKQYQRLSRIDTAERQLIDKAFQEHGQSISQIKDQGVSQEFNQAVV